MILKKLNTNSYDISLVGIICMIGTFSDEVIGLIILSNRERERKYDFKPTKKKK